MGNKIQLPLFLSSFQSTNTHSYQQLKQKVHLINSAFKENKWKLMMSVELKPGTVRYEQMNWRKSTVRGSVGVGKRGRGEMGGMREEREEEGEWVSEEVVLTYEDVNMLYDEMKNLHHKPTTPTPLDPTKTLTPTQTSSPTPKTPLTPTLSQPEQCCICLQHTPSMVLPCSHAFCDNCTVKYIIEAQQKKCPQCRQQIKGSRESVQKQIFTVVQDEEVYEQVRLDVLQVMRNLNPRVVNNFQLFLKEK